MAEVAGVEEFRPGVPHDVALMNWPRQDYAAESLLDRTPETSRGFCRAPSRRRLSFLYWLQQDVPRDRGGRGYPELMLRADAMGTADGLSKYPYIRESRRMWRADGTEQDVVEELQQGPRAKWFADSIGIGFYMVDIHPCGANERGRDAHAAPVSDSDGGAVAQRDAELPAGREEYGGDALDERSVPAASGGMECRRIRAMIAAMQLELGAGQSRSKYRRELAHAGVPLVWFDDIGPDHPAFAAIQISAIAACILCGPDLPPRPTLR